MTVSSIMTRNYKEVHLKITDGIKVLWKMNPSARVVCTEINSAPFTSGAEASNHKFILTVCLDVTNNLKINSRIFQILC